MLHAMWSMQSGFAKPQEDCMHLPEMCTCAEAAGTWESALTDCKTLGETGGYALETL